MVWSDPQVQRLCREFVCATEEVDILFPRNEWLINHLKDDAGVRLFRDVYGKQVPRRHWDPSVSKTKQGVYAMMPDGTYLSARFVGARKDEVVKLLEEALVRWRGIVRERGLKVKAVPQRKALSGWVRETRGKGGLLLEVSYRDLPRRGGRMGPKGLKVGESWNREWLEFDAEAMGGLVPKGEGWEDVPKGVRDRFFCEGLKDIVYGQSPNWKVGEIKGGVMRVRRGGKVRGGVVVELMGDFSMNGGGRAFEGKLLGKGIWDGKRFVKFELVALGERSGRTRFNFRKGDEAGAGMGVVFSLGD